MLKIKTWSLKLLNPYTKTHGNVCPISLTKDFGCTVILQQAVMRAIFWMKYKILPFQSTPLNLIFVQWVEPYLKYLSWKST